MWDVDEGKRSGHTDTRSGATRCQLPLLARRKERRIHRASLHLGVNIKNLLSPPIRYLWYGMVFVHVCMTWVDTDY